jgi:hypothetical protein
MWGKRAAHALTTEEVHWMEDLDVTSSCYGGTEVGSRGGVKLGA